MTSNKCWLWDNGWAESSGLDGNTILAGYMDNGKEQEWECYILRKDNNCPVHCPAPSPSSNDFNEYEQNVVRTLAEHPDKGFGLAILGLGLAGEAGEAADIIKKVVGHKHEFDNEMSLKLLAELGDVLWYVTAIATTLDLGLAAVVQYNVEKLQKRYPEGFSSERSINRLDA